MGWMNQLASKKSSDLLSTVPGAPLDMASFTACKDSVSTVFIVLQRTISYQGRRQSTRVGE